MAATAPRAALVLAVLLLAGCGAKSPGASSARLATDLPMLQGYVFDQAVHPVARANVTVQGVGVLGANGTRVTGTDGHFAFPRLPEGRALVVIVQAPALKSVSKQVVLTAGNSTLLNFTLEPLPVATPYHEAQGFNGFLGCETSVTQNGQTQVADCSAPGTGVENRRVWVFNVNPDVRSIVIETQWTPGAPSAQYLHARVETVGLGDQNALLAEVTGASVLKAQVSQAQCLKFFPQGGTVQVTWDVDADAVDQESPAGAAFATQQDFKAVATSFYVEPAPPDFTSAS